ncbi:multiprotein-bridging factor 1 family protein [Amycolatopsis japonica]|uniref:multiprotein-bridging factor 1 family protein n=1 Tax=Amycolatopsis japonica TaxID=208439 RepID=UPI0037B1770C
MGDRRTAFAARREAMGYTQESFAAELKAEVSTVSRWERGEATPQPFRRPRIAKALDVTLQELGTLLEQAPASARCPATAAVVSPDPAEADDMNRRDLLRLFSATGALLALPATGDVVLADAASGGALDAMGAEESAVFDGNLWRVYGLASNKSQVLPLVRTQLDVLTDALRQSQTPATRRRLCQRAADLFQLAGEIYFDGDRYTDAAHCYTLAAAASKEAGAPDLWACALTRHAFIAVYEHQYTEAVPLLDLAATLASRGDTDLSTQHWVAAVQAETFAGLGDLDACQRALETAAEVQHLTGPVHNGGWLRFDGSRLAEERGTCFVTLGRLDLAEAALTDALNAALTTRRKAGVLTDLAMIGVHRADPEQVVAYADTVLATARKTGSGVVARKLRDLQPYLAPMLGDQNIQRLDVEITDLISGHVA